MFAAIAQQVCEDCGDHMGSGWWWAIGIGWLVLLGLLVVLVIALTRRSHGANPSRSTGRDVLDERFARGEIDEDEYRRRKDALQS